MLRNHNSYEVDPILTLKSGFESLIPLFFEALALLSALLIEKGGFFNQVIHSKTRIHPTYI
jgi:hypothetical protein